MPLTRFEINNVREDQREERDLWRSERARLQSPGRRLIALHGEVRREAPAW